MKSWAFPAPSYLASLLCLSTRSFCWSENLCPQTSVRLSLPLKVVLVTQAEHVRLVLSYHFLTPLFQFWVAYLLTLLCPHLQRQPCLMGRRPDQLPAACSASASQQGGSEQS